MTTPEPSSLSAEDTALVADALTGHRQLHDPRTGSATCQCGEWEGPFTLVTPEWPNAYQAHLSAVLAPVLAQIRADERRRAEEREAALRAKCADYVNLVSRIHAVYAGIVMDTDEDRALHAKHVETANKALALARAALAADEPEAAEGGAEREGACGCRHDAEVERFCERCVRVGAEEGTRVGVEQGAQMAMDRLAALAAEGKSLTGLTTPPGHDESPEAGAREEAQ